jgi:hypothetical protein
MAQGNCENSVFHVDDFIVDGIKIKIEESSATVSGLAGYENEVIVTAGNDTDAIKRKKVARIIKAKLVLGDLKQIKDIAMTCSAQVSLRDTHSGQRILFTTASFMKIGDVGGGAVDLEMVGLSQPIFM